METRAEYERERIFLIGFPEGQIEGNKLPSNKQVLQVFFYALRVESGNNIRSSALKAIQLTEEFWNKARIPVRRTQKSIEKLEGLYQDWRNVAKNEARQTSAQVERVKVFEELLDELFDIAHNDALKLITIEEDKQFLINQRKKGRVGYMSSVDEKLAKKELNIELRHCQEENRDQRAAEEILASGEKLVLMSSESSENSNEEPIPGKSACEPPSTDEPPSKRIKRARKQFISPELVATFDRCKVSDRNAVMLLTETVKALKLDPDEYVINKSSIQRCREKLREEQFDKIRKIFEDTECSAIVIHWDGKLLPSIDSSKKENTERLPVIASYLGKEQLLGIAEIESSSGLNQATAIFELLYEWNIAEKVQALCSDTTASNTGRLNGACVLLEQMLERELLYFPCRHHILEVMLRGVFDEKLENSSAPIVPIFKKFQTSWPEIEKNHFQSGMEDEFVRQVITEPESKELIEFCVVELSVKQSREDYAELMFLIIMFLGGEEKTIRAPGAFHHARWMAKALYCLKIFLFRSQFDLNEQERTGIRDICIFIVKIYGKYWIQATSPTKAPRLDNELLKELKVYEEIDANLSKTALNKIKNHLWYLSPENVALSFFDDGVSTNVKKKMVLALDNFEEEELLFKRIPLPNSFENDMDQFVSSTTLNFFLRFGISTSFLKTDPETWESNNEYQFGKKITTQLRVVNDVAERGVKLIADYNNIITKNEEQKQFLVQIVAQHRKDFPDVKRETLKKGG